MDNIVSLARCDGQEYDEEALLDSFPTEGEGKAPANTRSVRNTREVLELSGLAIRDASVEPQELRLTRLGRSVFSFLGVTSEQRFATEESLPLLAEPLIRGLSIVQELRAIWLLMRLSENRLNNEELNRCMNRTTTIEDVPDAAQAVRNARRSGDPTEIGKRFYDQGKYENEDERGDQRKAINPLFLLAGGGGIFITLAPGDDFRRLEDWAVPMIDSWLAAPGPRIHLDNNPDAVRQISEYAAAPDWVEDPE